MPGLREDVVPQRWPNRFTASTPPDTNGVLAPHRYHRTLKSQVNLLVYDTPMALERAVASFVDYCNHRRCHEALRNVTPADVYNR